MPRYRTKPVEIDAVQWREDDDTTFDAVMAFMSGEMSNEPNGWLKGVGRTITHVYDYLQTEWIPVNDGDYIIRGKKGEYYPCEQEVFDWKYEVVHTPTNAEIQEDIDTIGVQIQHVETDRDERVVYADGKVEMLNEDIATLEESKNPEEEEDA